MDQIENLRSMVDLYLKNEKQPLPTTCNFEAQQRQIVLIATNINEQLQWSEVVDYQQAKQWLLKLDRYQQAIKLLNHCCKKQQLGWKAKFVDQQTILITFYNLDQPEEHWGLTINQKWFGYLQWDESNKRLNHHFFDWIKVAINPIKDWLDPELMSYYQ